MKNLQLIFNYFNLTAFITTEQSNNNNSKLLANIFFKNS